MGSIRNLPLLGASYNFKLLLWGAVPKKTWNWQFSRWIPMGSSDKKRRLSFCKFCAEWLLIQTHTFHRQHCPGCMKSQRANVLIEIYNPFDDQASTGTSWKAFSATSRAASHCISPWDHKLAARQYFWRDAYFILKSYSCLAGSLSPSNLIRLGALRMEFMTKEGNDKLREYAVQCQVKERYVRLIHERNAYTTSSGYKGYDMRPWTIKVCLKMFQATGAKSRPCWGSPMPRPTAGPG